MRGKYERHIFPTPRQKQQRGQPGLIHTIPFSPCPFSLDHHTQARDNLQAIDHPQTIGIALADAGYCREANLTAVVPEGPELLVATNKDWKQRKAQRDQPVPRGRIPKHLTARERMERALLTKRGRRLYKTRGHTVEPVFGQIKDVRGCERFMRRGEQACASEWKLLCTTHNLLKLWRSGKTRWANQHRRG